MENFPDKNQRRKKKTWEKIVEGQEELWEDTARWRGLVAIQLT